MRPTGRLQIGNYFGALQNWVRLQNDPSHDCFYFVADWHALTSDYADTSAIAENTLQVAIDFLAAGLDPQKSTIFLQSQVPEHAELHLLLSMITPLGWLERVPTYKEALDNIKNKDLHTYGFLGYPTLQAADIVMYSDPGKPLIVPVGEDQVAHVEMSRELVRKFNLHYLSLDTEALSRPENIGAYLVIRGSFDPEMRGARQLNQPTVEEVYELQTLIKKRIGEVGRDNFLHHLETFEDFKIHHAAFRRFLKEPLVVPEHLLTPTPRVPGLDGRKMSKSYGNAITLSESDADIRSKTKVMITDPKRKRRTDPGEPNDCPVYDWHKLFSTPERDPGRLDWVRSGCRTAGIGCIECKAAMADNLIKWIEPIRARRLDYEQHPKRVLEILHDGSAQARREAAKTMDRVRQAVFHWSDKERQLGFPPPRN
jgi:tryptophanyl-tRNA synthetase